MKREPRGHPHWQLADTLTHSWTSPGSSVPRTAFALCTSTITPRRRSGSIAYTSKRGEGVLLAEGRKEGTAVVEQAGESVRSAKVRVPLHAVLLVKPGDGLLHELLDRSSVVAKGHELGDPDRSIANQAAHLQREVLEIVNEEDGVVPVDRDEIDSAAGTVAQKLAHPGVAIVRDRGGAKLGLSSKWLHVLEVGIGSWSGVDVGLALVLRLIEGQEV